MFFTVFISSFDACYDIFKFEAFFRDDDFVSTCCNTCPKSDITCVTSHYFNNESTTVTWWCITNLIDCIHCSCYCTVKSDCKVSTHDIVRKSNSRKSMFSQAHSSMIRTVTTDNHDTFDTVFFQLLNPFKLTFEFCKLRVTGWVKESTTTWNDVSYWSSIKWINFTSNHTSVSIIDTKNFHSCWDCLTNNCSNGSIHTRGVPTTSQNSNTFHLVLLLFL